MLLERVTQAGDVAVTEDREHPREERGDAAVGHHGLLSDEVPDDGVGRCESDRFRSLLMQSRVARVSQRLSRSTVSHFSDFHERSIASCTLT